MVATIIQKSSYKNTTNGARSRTRLENRASARNAEATVTDEQTGNTKPFTPDNTVEEEQTVLTVPFYKTKNGNTYLRVSFGKEDKSFGFPGSFYQGFLRLKE